MRYRGQYDEGFVFDDPYSRIEFTRGSRIVASTATITVSATASYSELIIGGTLKSGGHAILGKADNTDVSVLASAEIAGYSGLRLEGDGQSITNYGAIEASTVSIHVEGADLEVNNQGRISGGTGVFLRFAEHAQLYNGRFGEIVGKFTAVDLGNFDGMPATAMLKNLGFISGTYSIAGSGHPETVINRGVMEGILFLGAGNDTFDGRHGTIRGTVEGGAQNDSYYIDTRTIRLVEQPGAGKDTVSSSVSFRLPENFEFLSLSGQKDLTGRGGNDDNVLIGNKGDNAVFGETGIDTLDGGKGGNDQLTGGMGQDIFVFRTGGGRDIITDFEDGADHIAVGGWSGMTNIQELLNHTRDIDGDVVIRLGQDRLTIENTTKSQLDANDFLV